MRKVSLTGTQPQSAIDVTCSNGERQAVISGEKCVERWKIPRVLVKAYCTSGDQPLNDWGTCHLLCSRFDHALVHLVNTTFSR